MVAFVLLPSMATWMCVDACNMLIKQHYTKDGLRDGGGLLTATKTCVKNISLPLKDDMLSFLLTWNSRLYNMLQLPDSEKLSR